MAGSKIGNQSIISSPHHKVRVRPARKTAQAVIIKMAHRTRAGSKAREGGKLEVLNLSNDLVYKG